MIELNIAGEPIAKARHRSRITGGRVITYDEQGKTKSLIKREIAAMYQGRILKEQVFILFEFICSRPKGHYGTGRNAGRVKGSSPRFKLTKPDDDNYEKFYKDCMSGIVYNDDKQIIFTSQAKRFACDNEAPMVKIKVSDNLENITDAVIDLFSCF